MKTTTTHVKTTANFCLIVLSSFGISYCLATYFIHGKEVSPLLVIASALVLCKSMISYYKTK